jgi:FKBP-type peptidyl-prolyl cis-trans isomerase
MPCCRPQPALAENPQTSGAMTSTEGDKQLIDPATDADLQSKPRQKTSSGLEYQEVVPGKGPSPSVGIQVHCLVACAVRAMPAT